MVERDRRRHVVDERPTVNVEHVAFQELPILSDHLPDELWIRKIGLPLRVSMAEFTADPAEVERMITTYSEFQKTVHDDMVGSFPYALDTLAALS